MSATRSPIHVTEPQNLWLPTAHVALVWSLTTLTWIGIGCLTLRALGLRRLDADRVLLAGFAGYAAVIAILQVWHLRLPVGVPALWLLLAGGLTGLALYANQLFAGTLRSLRRHPLAWSLATLTVLWMANVASGPCQFGDTGMYHLPMARWLVEYPIVPGLANLHGRFGFNNASLLHAALFECGPFEGRSHHFVNGPLVLLFGALVLRAIVRWSRADERAPSASSRSSCACCQVR